MAGRSHCMEEIRPHPWEHFSRITSWLALRCALSQQDTVVHAEGTCPLKAGCVSQEVSGIFFHRPLLFSPRRHPFLPVAQPFTPPPSTIRLLWLSAPSSTSHSPVSQVSHFPHELLWPQQRCIFSFPGHFSLVTSCLSEGICWQGVGSLHGMRHLMQMVSWDLKHAKPPWARNARSRASTQPPPPIKSWMTPLLVKVAQSYLFVTAPSEL